MRVSPVGPGTAWTRQLPVQNRKAGVSSARQLKGRVRATGGAGHNRTHERDDGINLSQGSGGQVDSNSTCPSSCQRTAFATARLGTARAESRTAKALSYWFTEVQPQGFQN